VSLSYLSEFFINGFIAQALIEDLGEGDFTSQACISPDQQSGARLLVKQDCVLAGVNLAEKILLKVDPKAHLTIFIRDGKTVKAGDVAFEVRGNAQAILKSERLLLNCMQRMSGVATLTAEYVQAVAHTSAKILDTRKTTPNFRALEKWAVVIGGGKNHRYDLSDEIMIKDNHIDYCGVSVSEAITKVQEFLRKKETKKRIVVEVRDRKELEQVLSRAGEVDRVLIDNFSIADLKEAVSQCKKGSIKTEASGGVTLQTVTEIAETGVDFISVGALTHSYQNIDLSLKAI
jgi:nicotinate-nucleotide pyrophosphorylase (carboxylating)